jgi:hypothetical protein
MTNDDFHTYNSDARKGKTLIIIQSDRAQAGGLGPEVMSEIRCSYCNTT